MTKLVETQNSTRTTQPIACDDNALLSAIQDLRNPLVFVCRKVTSCQPDPLQLRRKNLLLKLD